MNVQDAIAWLESAKRYFTGRPTGGEDSAHWANVCNGENCDKIANVLRSQQADIKRLCSEAGDAALDLLAAHGQAQEALDECQRLRALTTWRPRDSAPRDGTFILAFSKTWGEMHVVSCVPGSDPEFPWSNPMSDSAWSKEAFSHWMPLPAPPQDGRKNG